jgi:hypothetical protein
MAKKRKTKKATVRRSKKRSTRDVDVLRLMFQMKH